MPVHLWLYFPLLDRPDLSRRKISSPFSGLRAKFPAFFDAMTDPDSFIPDPALAEEWDNPAMTEFKRQEAEERVAFGQSRTREEWIAAFEESRMADEPVRMLAKPVSRAPFKVVQLPW